MHSYADKGSMRAAAYRTAAALFLIASALLLVSTVAGGQGRQTWANDPNANSSNVGPPGRWRGARAESEPLMTEEQERELERLRSIGYLAGSKPATASSGVTVHDARRACDGLNFYTSGHFAGALLMDMDGRILHEWRYDFLKVWPDETDSMEVDGAEYLEVGVPVRQRRCPRDLRRPGAHQGRQELESHLEEPRRRASRPRGDR